MVPAAARARVPRPVWADAADAVLPVPAVRGAAFRVVPVGPDVLLVAAARPVVLLVALLLVGVLLAGVLPLGVVPFAVVRPVALLVAAVPFAAVPFGVVRPDALPVARARGALLPPADRDAAGPCVEPFDRGLRPGVDRRSLTGGAPGRIEVRSGGRSRLVGGLDS